MQVFNSLIQQFQKGTNSLQINVRIHHPDSVFTLVSKDVGCEAFALSQRSKLKCEAFMSVHSLCEQSVWHCNYFLKINPKSNSISIVQIKKILW